MLQDFLALASRVVVGEEIIRPDIRPDVQKTFGAQIAEIAGEVEFRLRARAAEGTGEKLHLLSFLSGRCRSRPLRRSAVRSGNGRGRRGATGRGACRWPSDG